MTCKVLSVVGARPNHIKIATICDAINSHNRQPGAREIQHLLVHTGEHCDVNTSDALFNDIELPKPDIFLGVGLGSDTALIANVMEAFEKVILAEKPSVVLVAGDADAVVACAVATKKTRCSRGAAGSDFLPKLAHVEAGLRSFDRTMPEELNRIVTDSLSDYLFTTEESANRHLLHEGISVERIYFVGSVTVDTLLRHLGKARESVILNDLQLSAGAHVRPYAILTLRRPGNIDDAQTLAGLLEACLEVSHHMPVIFPVRPHLLRHIRETDLGDYLIDHFMEGPEPWDSRVRIRLVPPLGYLDFLQLMSHARVVLTDSAAIQEETTILGVPCITLRESAERPVTLKVGTNVLAGTAPERIVRQFTRIIQRSRGPAGAPELWDGNAANRIVQILADDPPSTQHSVSRGNEATADAESESDAAG
jgi:UDP-N-acetylglucosamine 2-epimerase (non-hydrolysing)